MRGLGIFVLLIALFTVIRYTLNVITIGKSEKKLNILINKLKYYKEYYGRTNN